LVESDVLDDTVMDPEMYLEVVPAQGIESVRRMICALGLPGVVARVSVVIENHLLVKITQFSHPGNSSSTHRIIVPVLRDTF
jgi:hypothetical protein